MPFVESNYKTMYDVKRDVQNDMVIPWATVHDEYDVICDKYLFNPIMKRVAEIATNKDVFNRLGMPYVNFTFDVEYGRQGSWLPDNAIEVYDIPRNDKEDKAITEWKQLRKLEQEQFVVTSEEDTTPSVTYYISSDVITDEMLEAIEKLPDGRDTLKVNTPVKTMQYKRTLDFTTFPFKDLLTK